MPRRDDFDEPELPDLESDRPVRGRALRAAAAFAVVCVLVVVAARATRDTGGSSGRRVAAADTTLAETTVPTTVATTTTVPGPLPCPPATGAATRVTTFELPPPECLESGATYRAVVTTSEGSFTMALDTKRSPRNVNSFVYLARYRFYDGLSFDRVIPGFIIQGGDPDGTGTGGPGYTVPDELPAGISYSVGTVAMANSGPDTNGSQFFVVSGSLGKELPKSYPVLGSVTSGLDVVRKIDALGVAPGADGSERPPVRRITIQTITIEQEGGTATSTTTATSGTTAASTTSASGSGAPVTTRATTA